MKGTKTFVLERNHARNADNEVCLDEASGAVLGAVLGAKCSRRKLPLGDECTSCGDVLLCTYYSPASDMFEQGLEVILYDRACISTHNYVR